MRAVSGTDRLRGIRNEPKGKARHLWGMPRKRIEQMIAPGKHGAANNHDWRVDQGSEGAFVMLILRGIFPCYVDLPQRRRACEVRDDVLRSCEGQQTRNLQLTIMLAVEELQGPDLRVTVDKGGNERRVDGHHRQTAKAGEMDSVKKAAEPPPKPRQLEFLEVVSGLQGVCNQPIVSLKKLPISGKYCLVNNGPGRIKHTHRPARKIAAEL